MVKKTLLTGLDYNEKHENKVNTLLGIIMTTSIDALNWKLAQTHMKPTPKTFLKALNHMEGGKKPPPSRSSPWALDITLYVFLFMVVITFVYIVMSFASDIKA